MAGAQRGGWFVRASHQKVVPAGCAVPVRVRMLDVLEHKLHVLMRRAHIACGRQAVGRPAGSSSIYSERLQSLPYQAKVHTKACQARPIASHPATLPAHCCSCKQTTAHRTAMPPAGLGVAVWGCGVHLQGRCSCSKGCHMFAKAHAAGPVGAACCRMTHLWVLGPHRAGQELFKELRTGQTSARRASARLALHAHCHFWR